MKKILSSILMMLLCLVMVVGCGGNPSDETSGGNPSDETSGGGGTSGGTQRLTMYTALNEAEVTALEAVAQSYTSLKRAEGVTVRVSINNNTDPDNYRTSIQGMITRGVNSATIVKTGAISEYYGTDQIVDLAPYLEMPNPYADDATWSDLIEEDGYLAQVERGTTTIPNISYDTNYLVVFYDKRAMEDLGLEVPETWAEFLNCLETTQQNPLFAHPLGLSVDTQSATRNFLGWVVQMYLDQYFRDFTDKAHSQEGEYSYINRVDGKYDYSPDNPLLGSSESYTFNLNRVIDTFFNQQGFAPDSARYENLMRNLYDLMEYVDPSGSNQNMFDRFNETVIHYNGGGYSDLKLFFINRLDYVSTYRTAHATTLEDGSTVYPTPEEIDETIGWFALPAMTSNPDMNGEGAPVADNVRSLGGAESMFGILNSNNQEYTDLAIDFLMYLYSPAGQNVRYARLKDLGAPVVMNQLVKNVTIDDSINLSDNVTFTGNCNLNPYLRVGYGYGLDTINIGSTGNSLQTSIATAVSDYLRGDDPDWTATGESIFQNIKDSFANYASDQNLIYSDYTQVASATNDFIRSPFANA